MPGNADDSVSASPPYISSFDYDSFSEFKKAINKEKKLYAELSDMRASEEITANFKAFVEKYQSQGVIVPYWNGKEIELRNEEGFSNISFFLLNFTTVRAYFSILKYQPVKIFIYIYPTYLKILSSRKKT